MKHSITPHGICVVLTEALLRRFPDRDYDATFKMHEELIASHIAAGNIAAINAVCSLIGTSLALDVTGTTDTKSSDLCLNPPKEGTQCPKKEKQSQKNPQVVFLRRPHVK